MGNPMNGEARLGEYTLAFNFGTFCELEDKTGMKMPDLLRSITEGMGCKDLQDFVWAGLQTNHKGSTEEVAFKIIDECGLVKATESVTLAIGNFFGPQKAKGKNPPKAA